jgi:hypothetical protein
MVKNTDRTSAFTILALLAAALLAAAAGVLWCGCRSYRIGPRKRSTPL